MKATTYKKGTRKQAVPYRRIRVKVASAFQVVHDAVERAVERGMNRCDKYHEEALTEAQRGLLLREVVDSFWIALEDAGLEVK